MSQEEEIVYEERCRAAYSNGYLAAGEVHGHEYDSMYIRIKREGEEESITIGLKQDEALNLIWLLSTILTVIDFPGEQWIKPLGEVDVRG